ncbi:MAG: thioredoxin-disulfide reductase [Deltaproteobacteria bacterium]|nr:MAG: thioredoxin-disulfide reductase [Deltaproteobacteria bacterium]
MNREEYDLIVIGGGPAGLTAGLYGVRAKLKTLLLEKLPLLGGQIINAEKVENYPGFPEGISGQELISKMETQAREFGLVIKTEEVKAIKVDGEVKKVVTEDGDYFTRSIIVATGASPSRLGVEGEERLIGRGISFCGTCDGFFFKDKDVIVVGGGDTAIIEALFLTRFVRKVTVVHRRNELRATKILQERAFKNEKIGFLWDSVVERIEGKETVEKVILRNVKTGETFVREIDGVFIFVGITPNSQFLKGTIDLDEKGFIMTDDNLETSVSGIFAAGDVRKKLLRQISTAVGDGATAAFAAEKYLEK